MSATDPVPIRFTSSSGVLSGLKEYLVSKPGVQDVSLTEGPPASHAQVHSWEKKNGCDLPQDLKDFYMSINGLRLTWKYLYSGVVHELGQLKVCAVQDLLPLGDRSQPISFAQEKGPFPIQRSTLSDIIDLTSYKFQDNMWSPSFGDGCKVFPINYCSLCGHTCLVYNTKDSECANADGQIWLLDLSLRWHLLSSTFADYLRLAVVHLALIQWPYALTDIGLSPQCEKWFQMFIPKRLEIDQSLAVSEVDFTTNKHNAVDTSKIIIMKPSKEKKSKVESKSQMTGNKRHD